MDKSRVEPTIFFIEKISFSMKLFSGYFYGQSFIKTVRGLFPFLDGDVPRSTSYGVYISQLIRFARASSYVTDFNTCTKLLTQKLLKQGYRYHKLPKTFSKFYRRYYDLMLDLNLFCVKDFRNLNSMVTWCIN